MNRKAKRVLPSVLVTLAAAATLTVATTPQASAIDAVRCVSDEFVRVTAHLGGTELDEDFCFANAGQRHVGGVQGYWATRIWTGNNRVQWYGDGRWQPAEPIGKNTVFTWPNHPGGVRIDGIRIL
ncbi:hypothetical protein IHE55_15805 [Streptomyces pactum]|uniref:Streptomyces killer toxin-like beta/gamma crystallin domain-containing protein n=1 Tax=Streptomyces pactum TaxID=68249 RepID=A0ABS0NLX2_9ACTN|nr:beta/gamma crystallin domain-containing protein [Streptomyces pactum]MBH5336171.1 hypothetical protein [Streptomyces pactum]